MPVSDNNVKVIDKAGKSGGLSKEINLFIGCRVMLRYVFKVNNHLIIFRRNISLSRGLVNGSMGYVTRFDKSDGYVTAVWVKFDDIDDEVKIERVSASYKVGTSIQRTRRQFPLTIAFGITIHKCQGITRKNVLAKLDEVFAPGMAYVFLIKKIKIF